MGSAARRAREVEDTRIRILDAARDLFEKNGYESVTMRAIADRIEYTAAALYKHFADKETLFRELADQDFEMLARDFQRFSIERDPLRRLMKMGLAYIEYALAHPNHYRLTFMTRRSLDQAPPEEAAFAQGRAVYTMVRTCLEQAMAEKRIRAGLDLEAITQAAWGSLHGIIALHLTLDTRSYSGWRPPLQTARVAIDCILAGIEPEQGKRR